MITENTKREIKSNGFDARNSFTGGNPTDEYLIIRVADGDDESLEEILRRYRERMHRIAFRITHNHSDAEDVVQEVSLIIYRKAHTFRSDARFSTWLYRLVTNESISRLRQIKRRKADSLDNYMPRFDDSGHHAERPVIDWSQDIEKRVAEREIHEIIERAMEQLSPLDRSVVVLSEVEELTNPEIGQILGLSVLAVKGRLHRARLFLRGKLTVTLGHSPA